MKFKLQPEAKVAYLIGQIMGAISYQHRLNPKPESEWLEINDLSMEQTRKMLRAYDIVLDEAEFWDLFRQLTPVKRSYISTETFDIVTDALRLMNDN